MNRRPDPRSIDSYSFTRRGFLRLGLAANVSVTVGALPGGAHAKESGGGDTASTPPLFGRAKRCILLFMGGGASQLETFDCKPGSKIGGDQKTIPSTVPGLAVNEYLPHMAKQMHHVALIRSMNTREGNHARAVYYLHTGYGMQGGLQHPAFGSISAEQLGPASFALPHYMAISQDIGHHLQGPMPTAGYLGAAHAPYVVDDIDNPVKNIEPWGGVARARFDARTSLREALDADLDARQRASIGGRNSDLYRRAIRMMHSPLARCFDFEREPPAIRELYGDTSSGKSMLLARRLAESGATFVEVILSGWDTHGNHLARSKQLNGQLDRPYAALLADLHQRGMLDDTLVVWMGEFGRTPGINKGKGRDHWTRGWTIALAGAGLEGGRIVGSTDDGGAVKERPVSTEDFFATMAHLMGIDREKTYYTQRGRPMVAIPHRGEIVGELL